MALNPQAVAAAFVATPNPQGAAAFGPRGIGLVVRQFGVPVFIKFAAQAGLTYTVSTNVLPGDLVVLGPNGAPLNPGAAIKAFSFTPNQSGLYMVEFVANPRFVAVGQEIDVSIQAQNAGLPTTVAGALHVLDDPVGNALRIANGSAITQYFLHAPDNNANGLAMAAPLDAPSQQQQFATAPTTPLETGSNDKPLTWIGYTDAPGQPGDPTQIPISAAVFNYDADQEMGPIFDHSLSDQQLNVLVAATHVWESVANIHFDFITDVPPTGGEHQPAGIRVGLSELGKGLDQPTMGFIGDTEVKWVAGNIFTNDNVVSVEDPTEHPVTTLSDGDFRYDNTNATMFQAFIHELGHAIGLDHNPDDPNSIMNPQLGSSNPLPDAQDVAAVQSLYGAPTKPLTISAAEQTTLNGLLHGVG